MKKTIIASSIIVFISIIAIIFIHFTNDHKECLIVSETIYLENDSVKKTTKKHICKEKYNL